MIITLTTGEKVKVKESIEGFGQYFTEIFEARKIIELTVLETKLLKGEFKEVETPVYYRTEHIVSYEEINT